MATVKECLILAAGHGSRIASLSRNAPKPLVCLSGAPLLEHILLSSQAAGIEKFVIVVGYRADAIRRWLAGWRHEGITVTLVENPDYHKANGISALAARGLLQGPFLLLMADHIFEPKTAKALLRQSLADGDEVHLGRDLALARVMKLRHALPGARTLQPRLHPRLPQLRQPLANRDEFHLGRDEALACVVELRDGAI